MSSRAIRRAQRERELQHLHSEQVDQPESSSEDNAPRSTGKAASAFELLNQADDGDEEEQREVPQRISDDDIGQDEDEITSANTSRHHKPRPAAMSKHKNRKRKKKNADGGASAARNHHIDVDDIDVALKELGVTNQQQSLGADSQSRRLSHEIFEVLAVDAHHLNVRNEMKRLFGDISFDEDPEEYRRHASLGDQIGLAEAVKGLNSASGAGLPAMIRRRNIFIQGQEDWPKASAGGLAMEIEEINSDGSILFRFVHNKAYQQAQKEFETCVQSMDPNLMVNLLRFNPYHIATLLQVSEIAKQEKDHATAGDLLERALFSYGRILHHKFPAAITEGKARLDFRRPENREFFLATWRYIRNIEMRATWRTAYEWARLLYQMDPTGDPYSILLMIDQLALRARQSEMYLRFINSQALKAWVGGKLDAANLRFSTALAEEMSGGTSAEETLHLAILKHPWIAARLFQALDIGNIPPSIWGRMPPTDQAKLDTELYVKNAIDLWKTSDMMSKLKSVAQKVDKGAVRTAISSSDNDGDPINLAVARHILLLEKSAFIALIPTEITSQLKSSFDPLPPENDLRSYETGISVALGIGAMHPSPQEIIDRNPQGFIEVLAETHRLFEILIPNFNERLEEPDNGGPLNLTEADVERALRTSHLPPQRLNQLFARLVVFRQALANQPGRRVEGRDGTAAYLTDTGNLRIEPGSEGRDTQGDSEDRGDTPLEGID